MSKEEESLIEEVDNTSDESSVEEEVIEETSVPLSQYEKIKDDYLRLAAEFDNYKTVSYTHLTLPTIYSV